MSSGVEKEPLGGAGRNVHESVSLKLAGSLKLAFPCPVSPFPALTTLSFLPAPWIGWLTKGLDVHTSAPFTLKGGGHPWLCLFFVPLAWGASPPSLPCAFLCLCSLICHDFSNYILLIRTHYWP